MSKYRICKQMNSRYLVQRRVWFWWVTENARNKPIPKDFHPRPRVQPSNIETYAKKIAAQFETHEQAAAWTYHWHGRYVKEYKPTYTHLTS